MIKLAFARTEMRRPLGKRVKIVREYLMLSPAEYDVPEFTGDHTENYLTFKAYEAVVALDRTASDLLFRAGVMHFYLPRVASRDAAVLAGMWAMRTKIDKETGSAEFALGKA